MLTKDDLKQLRHEIVLNSIYIDDYKNSLNIPPYNVCIFFDSYLEELYDIAREDGWDCNKYDKDNITKMLEKYDNIENLYNYYWCFEGDPLRPIDAEDYEV